MNSLKKYLYGVSLLVLACTIFLGTSAYSKCECYTLITSPVSDEEVKYRFRCYDSEDTLNEDHLSEYETTIENKKKPIEKVISDVFRNVHPKPPRCVQLGTEIIPPSKMKSDE